jgi:hypothetical protein
MQNTSHIGNLKVVDDFFDGREVGYIPIELVEIVKLYHNHPNILLLSYLDCNLHARWEMNLIQQHELNSHICILCLRLQKTKLNEVEPTSSLWFTIAYSL